MNTYEIIIDNQKNVTEKRKSSIQIIHSKQKRSHICINGFSYRFDHKLALNKRGYKNMLTEINFTDAESYRCTKTKCTGRMHVFISKEGEISGYMLCNPHDDSGHNGCEKLNKTSGQDENINEIDSSENVCIKTHIKVVKRLKDENIKSKTLKSYDKCKRPKTISSAIEKMYGAFKLDNPSNCFDILKKSNIINNALPENTNSSDSTNQVNKTNNRTSSLSLSCFVMAMIFMKIALHT